MLSTKPFKKLHKSSPRKKVANKKQNTVNMKPKSFLLADYFAQPFFCMAFLVILLEVLKYSIEFCVFLYNFDFIFRNIFGGHCSTFWKLWTKTLKLWSKILKMFYFKQVSEFILHLFCYYHNWIAKIAAPYCTITRYLAPYSIYVSDGWVGRIRQPPAGWGHSRRAPGMCQIQAVPW